jgi:uncharacterized membrane protein YkoI
MRGVLVCLGVSAVVGLAVLATDARAGDKGGKVALDKVPKKVLDAVKARFPGAEITSVGKETVGGDVVYDIEMKVKGRKHEMDIKEDGTVLEVENEIPAKDLPKAVRKALETKFPKSTIKEAMEVNLVKNNKEKLDHYEVTLQTADNRTVEVTVSLDGKEVKGGEKEKEKK